MRKLVGSTFVTLDGVISDPQVWGPPYWDEEHFGYARKLLEPADALLLGRRTYESFAGAWPEREGEFADKFNQMPKYLVSSTLTDPEWNNTTVLEGDVVEAVRKLRDEFDGTIQVPGSRQLVQDLVENDLVDQINLMIFPVVLGTGKKVFGDYSDKKAMKLVESKTVGDGVLVVIYQRV
jgi:dihydrofolate reductase